MDTHEPRACTLRARAASQNATRQRIVQATVELHRSVGPARTTISAVATRAGVQRHTVYRHFPDQKSLFRACTGHFLSSYPPPDTKEWSAISDPEIRLRRGLGELYAYYDTNAEMIASVLRDSTLMPVGGGFRALQTAAVKALERGRNVRGSARRKLRAALQLATDFHAWQALTTPSGLTPTTAAELMSC